MKSYVKFMDNLPLVGKLIFALPALDGLFYGLYRIGKGQVLIGILWILFGLLPGAIIDIVTIILNGKVTFLV